MTTTDTLIVIWSLSDLQSVIRYELYHKLLFNIKCNSRFIHLDLFILFCCISKWILACTVMQREHKHILTDIKWRKLHNCWIFIHWNRNVYWTLTECTLVRDDHIVPLFHSGRECARLEFRACSLISQVHSAAAIQKWQSKKWYCVPVTWHSV